MKKLAILGCGTAGIQSLCHFLAHLPRSEWRIDLIHNPNIPSLGIGESTNGSFFKTLQNGIDFNFIVDHPHIDATIKHTTKYERWRENDIMAVLLQGDAAIHFNTFKLANFAIPRFKEKWGKKFNEIQGNVSDVVNGDDYATVVVDGNELQYDYVMDSRGFPKDFTNYWQIEEPLLNHALVHNITGDGANWRYTTHRATLDGWMFQVPLTSRISHGYLFNDTMTSVEQAKINFSKEIDVPVDELDNIEYKFKPFWAKTVFENRVIKNGNAAVFFEPMFANSLANYDDINKNFHQFLTGKCTEAEVNIRFLRRSCQVRDIICYIYHGGSMIDSPYWIWAKKTATERLKQSYFFYEAMYEMKKINQEDVFPDKPYRWIWNDHELNMYDRWFGYNYFQVDHKDLQ